MYGHAYSLSPSGIFVAPDSPYQTPQDLAGIEIGRRLPLRQPLLGYPGIGAIP
jgi:hypothetical protein